MIGQGAVATNAPTQLSGQEGWSQASYDTFGFLSGEPRYLA
jgi:hypothetical protein